MSSTERIIWQGHPSHVKYLGTFILCGLTFWLVVPIFIALFKWLENRCFTYELTNQRLRTKQGIFNKKTDEIELYRIKDMSIVEPFGLRMFSLGNIVLLTSDKSTPELIIEAVPHAEELQQQIRDQVEALRDTKRVREVDFE